MEDKKYVLKQCKSMERTLSHFSTQTVKQQSSTLNLSSLNKQQTAAVVAPTSPCLVLAGPGSGKTQVLTYRVAHLIQDCKIDPRGIFAVTFTNKAANEMKGRVASLLSKQQSDLLHYVGTFHSICCKILRVYAPRVRSSLKGNFTIIDTIDQKGIVQKIIKNHSNVKIAKAGKQLSPEFVLSQISFAKNRALSATEFARDCLLNPSITFKDPSESFEYLAAVVFQSYETFLIDNNMLDFDDLLLCTMQLFQKDEEVRHVYARRCKALLIDEFQDSNMLQYEISKYLASVHQNIFAVGDPDQSIYGFRNADTRVTQKYLKEFRTVKIIVLEENYRSTQSILTCSHTVIDCNSDRLQRKLYTKNVQGPPISILEYNDPEGESQSIAKEIVTLMKGNSNLRYKDFAVLLRTNAMSRSLETAFLGAGIKYKMIGAFKFYDRMEIKDLLSYLRLADNLSDSVSFERAVNVPKRGIGDKSLKHLIDAAKRLNTSAFDIAKRVCMTKEKISGVQFKASLRSFVLLILELIEMKDQGVGPLHILEHLIKSINYKKYLKDTDQQGFDNRWENVKELKNVCAEFSIKEQNQHIYDPESTNTSGQPLTRFIESITLVPTNQQEEEDQQDQDLATISTFHSAKGLEFSVVFIVGVEEGVLPFYRASKAHEIEEERRLLFVGMTRAKVLLYLSYTQFRFQNGYTNGQIMSNFLKPLVPSNQLSVKKEILPVVLRPLSKQRIQWSELNKLLVKRPSAKTQSPPRSVVVASTIASTSTSPDVKMTERKYSPPQIKRERTSPPTTPAKRRFSEMEVISLSDEDDDDILEIDIYTYNNASKKVCK